MRGPKTRWELAAQLLLLAGPYGLALAMGIREFRGRPEAFVVALPAFVVLLAGWIGYSAWAIGEYRRWSRGLRPALATSRAGAFAPCEVELPPELLSSPHPLPSWARPRRGALAAFAAAALVIVGFFSLANDGGFMLRIALACIGAIIAVALPPLVLRRARRRLLALGMPAVATVSEVTSYKGRVAISYDFATPNGRRTGTTTVSAAAVVSRYGGWPKVGDCAVIVYDDSAFVKSTLWSLPAGREPPARMTRTQVALWALLAIAFVVLYQVFSAR